MLTTYLAAHDAHLRAKRRSPATIQWYAEQFAAYLRWASENAAADQLPDADQIDAFLADQHAAGLSPATVHARYRALRALCMFLERRRRITSDANPIRLVDAPSVPRRVRRFVPLADAYKLLLAANGATWLDARDRLILNILFFSGLRVGELCALSVSDINPDERSILVAAGKGDKARMVPCTSETISAFLHYIYIRPLHADQLLLASDGYYGAVGPLHREGVRQMLIRRCTQAGIAPAYSPHAFRHGFAMWLLNAGARITTVSSAMGHADLQITTTIYAHTTIATVRSEYDAALANTLRK